MDTLDFKFEEPDESICQSAIKIIGVGSRGGRIVDNLCRKGLTNIKVDFAIIDDDQRALDSKTSVAEKICIARESEDINERMHAIIGEWRMVIVLIAELDGDYNAYVVSTLCRQFHPASNDEEIAHRVSLVLPIIPSGTETGGLNSAYDLSSIEAVATKVIPSENEQFIYGIVNSVCQTIHNPNLACNPVDYNDFATVFQYGQKAVAVTGEDFLSQCADTAAIKLKRKIEESGSSVHSIKYIYLHFGITHIEQCTIARIFEMFDTFCQAFDCPLSVLRSFTESGTDNKNMATYSVIAML